MGFLKCQQLHVGSGMRGKLAVKTDVGHLGGSVESSIRFRLRS